MTTIRRFAGGLWMLIRKYPNRAQLVVQGALGTATAFGLGWTAQQVAAVMFLSAAVLAFLTEQAVTPTVDPTLPSGSLLTVTTPDPQVADKVVTVR